MACQNIIGKGRMKRAALILSFLLVAGVASAKRHWVGTWGTAPQLVERHNNPPAPGLDNNSLRQIVQVSIGGKKVRLKLTNEFSKEDTEIKAVELAIAKTAGSSSEIDEASTVSLTFDGQASVTIPAGGTVVSDAVKFPIQNRQNVAVTIHYGAASSTSVSGHPGSRTTSYLKAGNTTDFSDAIKTDHWYHILALEVEAPMKSGAVAILGNSITDGRGSTTNQQNRWADVLSRVLTDVGEGAAGHDQTGGGTDAHVADLLRSELHRTALKAQVAVELEEVGGVDGHVSFTADDDLCKLQQREGLFELRVPHHWWCDLSALRG